MNIFDDADGDALSLSVYQEVVNKSSAYQKKLTILPGFWLTYDDKLSVLSIDTK